MLVSIGMMDRLKDQELQAVLLHELAHGTEGLGIAGGTIGSLAAVYGLYTYWLKPSWPTFAEVWLWIGWAWTALGMLHARRLSEFHADAIAAHWMKTARPLRQALMQVAEAYPDPKAKWLMLLSPHPSTSDRLRALDRIPWEDFMVEKVPSLTGSEY